MKRTVRFLAFLLLFTLVFGLLAAHADEEPWSEEYYRALDFTESISEAERSNLDETCIDIMRRHKADVVVIAVDDSGGEREELEALSRAIYADYGFGYGETRDGFCVIFDTEEQVGAITVFGAAEGRLARSDLYRIEEQLPDFYEEYGVYGVLNGGAHDLDLYLAELDGETESTSGGDTESDTEGTENTIGATTELPAWYPDDPKNFTFFHDPTAPRVVDLADIFTDEEEARMEARLAVLREELGRDIVIYTDVTDYGKGRAVWAADFYDFNGYGIGDEREGMCLFINMNRYNRGWWTCCTGSETMALYTEKVANVIDDRLYDAMSKGSEHYAEGVENWIEDVRGLYRTGRAPKSLTSWIVTVLGSILGGSAVGGVSLGVAKVGMHVPKPQRNATSYLTANGVRVQTLDDKLLNVDTTRRYAPIEKSDSGGGGSSYSGSYSGSSGSSHSGSGRSF